MLNLAAVEVIATSHRQQLMAEATMERLAAQARPARGPRRTNAIARFIVRLSAAAILAATSFASSLGGARPTYASGDTVDVDVNGLYNIATLWGLNVVEDNATDDSPVSQSGATYDFNRLWHFRPIGISPSGATQYQIVNQDSLRCLSVYYDSRQSGGKIVIYDCHDDYKDQQWTLIAHGALVLIQSVSSGLYLDVPGFSATWGTQLDQIADSNPGNLPSDLFGLVKRASISTSPSAYRLTSNASLAVDVVSYDNDAAVIQTGVKVGSPTQSWRFERQPDGYYEVVNVGTGKCLSVYYNLQSNGTPLVQYDCHGWQDQQWVPLPIFPNANQFALESVSSHRVVDIPGGTIIWNTQLDQWGWSDAPNQFFTLTLV